MAVTYKVLGQAAPGAGVDVSLYTVPAATMTVVSTLAITNRTSAPVTFRVRVAVAGAAADPKQYLAYDIPLAGGSFVTLTIGVTLAATDQIVVQASSATVTFQAFGQEVA